MTDKLCIIITNGISTTTVTLRCPNQTHSWASGNRWEDGQMRKIWTEGHWKSWKDIKGNRKANNLSTEIRSVTTNYDHFIKSEFKKVKTSQYDVMDVRKRYNRKTERIKDTEHFENSKLSVIDGQYWRIFHIHAVGSVSMHRKLSLWNIITNIVR